MNAFWKIWSFVKGLGKTQDGIVEMSEIATSSKSGGQSVGKTARVKTVVARVLIGPEEELKRKGFHGNYRSLFFKEDGSPRKNDEYWKGMDGILMASTQYRDRLKYHTRKLSEQFFGLLKADPANLAAGLKFYVDLLSDVRHFNSKSEHSGIKVRSKYLDEFFFGEAFSERSKKKSEGGTPAFWILTRYRGLSPEDRQEVVKSLRAIRNEGGEFAFIERDSPARSFISTLLYHFSEVDGKPNENYVTLGGDGDRYSGFGLRVNAQNAKRLFTTRDVSRCQMWFSKIDGDIGISNLNFSRRSGWFSHLKNTLNSNVKENWFSENLEKLTASFSNNAMAYSWIENSAAYGVVMKIPALPDSAPLEADLDRFSPQAAINSTPGPLGYSLVTENSFYRGEFTTGGRFSTWIDSGRSLTIGSDSEMQKDDNVLFQAQSIESLDGAFVQRGAHRMHFNGGFRRSFSRGGLQGCRFKDAGDGAMFVSSKDRSVGDGSTWEGSSFKDAVFIGVGCFSHDSAYSKGKQRSIATNQNGSLANAFLLDGAMSGVVFAGDTLKHAEILWAAHSSSFELSAGGGASVFPGSLADANVSDGAFTSACLFWGIRNAKVDGGFLSAILCSDAAIFSEMIDRLIVGLRRRSNVAYASDAKTGTGGFNHNSQLIVSNLVDQAILRIGALHDAGKMNIELRVPFAGTQFMGESMLHGAFMDDLTVRLLQKETADFVEQRKKTGRFAIVASDDIRALVMGAADSRNIKNENSD